MSNTSGGGAIKDGFPGQDAQEARNDLVSLLAAMRNMGEQSGQGGLPISPASAPTLMAAHAICLHLHHLTTKLNKLDELVDGWKYFHDSLANVSDRISGIEDRLDEAKGDS